MKKMILVALALLSPILLAETIVTPEMRGLMEKLEDDDFDVRERATSKLGQSPEEYALLFILMARESSLPETQMRLTRAAKYVFLRKILPATKEWKAMFGDFVGILSQEYDSSSEEHPYVLKVQGSPNPGQEDLLRDDIILEINGMKAGNFGYNLPLDKFNEAGCILTLVVKRQNYKEDKEGNRTPDGDPVTLTIKVKVGWKDSNYLTEQEKARVQELQDQSWEKYLNDADD